MEPTEPTPYQPILRDDRMTSAAIERRLTLRLLAYWERLRMGRQMPTEADINPDGDISDMWDDCFLIHTSDVNMEDYNFIYLGSNIQMILTGAINDDPSRSWKSLNVKQLAPDIQKVLDNKSPVLNEGEILNDANQRVKYRQCLLPLGEEDKVLAIFGGMSCKIYP